MESTSGIYCILRSFKTTIYILMILATRSAGVAFTSTTSWWLLGTSAVDPIFKTETSANDYKTFCKTQTYLVDKQKEICLTDRTILKTVAEGATIGLDECQKQFARNRWNCSTVDNHNSSSMLGTSLVINSREKAYIYAISAAGVAYSVTRACSQGEIPGCGCDKRLGKEVKGEDFEWGGCSDDVSFGEKFSRDFVDSKETKRTAESLMNLHNNEAGRQHLQQRMKQTCKCHGVSGACSIKVCWRKLPGFKDIGNSLTRKYDGAHQVKMNERKGRLRPRTRHQKYPGKDDLVYLDKSPNYCESSSKFGIAGTSGRKCNQTSSGMDGCNLLCCGRGYKTLIKTQQKKCGCKFVWCCEIKCNICQDATEEYVCN